MISFLSHWSYAQKLFGLLSGLLVLRVLCALLLPLSPQEAYYWVFSLHPDWSYFDHPPMVAYTILFFSRLLGTSVLSIRLGALLYSFGFSWLTYLIGKRLFDERTGFWASGLMNLLPTFIITSLILTPDCPLVFFWCLALYLSLRAIQENRFTFYYGAGISLGLALLSKYTAIFFPLSLFFFLLSSPAHRHHLKRKEPYLGLCLALLVFSPVIFWNLQHQWASFAFQSTERAREMIHFSLRDLGAYLATQIGILTPLVFAGLTLSLGLGLQRCWKSKPWNELFPLSMAMPMVFFFTLVATREWVKMNWLIPAYPPMLLLMVFYFGYRHFPWGWIYRWSAKGVWISVGLIFIVFHLWPFIPQVKVSGSADTFSGWKELAIHVDNLKKTMDPQKPPFMIGWGHKTASELHFYLKGQTPTYAQTVLGKKGLGYDYWFDPKPLQGKDALFVYSDFERFPDENSGLLEKYFERTEPLEPFKVYRGKHVLRTFRIIRCYGYKG